MDNFILYDLMIFQTLIIGSELLMKFIDNYVKRISDNEEEAEIISFGLYQLVVLVIGISVAVIIGFLMGIPFKTMFLIALLFPLRQNAGGFHANGKISCSILSVTIFLISLYLIKEQLLTQFIGIMVYSVGSIMLIPFAPVGNRNKLLDESEIRVYGKRTMIIWITESILFVILEGRGLLPWANIVAISILICGALVIIGFLQEKVTKECT